jgi:hypothetical protein
LKELRFTGFNYTSGVPGRLTTPLRVTSEYVRALNFFIDNVTLDTLTLLELLMDPTAEILAIVAKLKKERLLEVFPNTFSSFLVLFTY